MRASLDVGPVTARTGEIASGFLRIGELADGVTPVQVPVIVMNGASDGPLLYVHAGSHGQETMYATEMLRRFVSEVPVARLAGAVVIVPVANLLAHQFATRIAPHYASREGVAFGGDLHKLWPGDPKGSLTQRIAHALWREVVSRCDAAIDLHAVGDPGMAFAFMYRGGKEDAQGTPAWDRSLEMARAFGLTVVTTAPNPLTLAGACLDAGKPAFMVEMTRARVLDDQVVEGALRGTRNVLVQLRMLEGVVEPQEGFLIVPGLRPALPTMRANRGGFIRFEVECGRPLAKGTVIATIRDVFGHELESIRMESDGYVMTFPPLSWTGHYAVATGDLVADIFA